MSKAHRIPERFDKKGHLGGTHSTPKISTLAIGNQRNNGISTWSLSGKIVELLGFLDYGHIVYPLNRYHLKM